MVKATAVRFLRCEGHGKQTVISKTGWAVIGSCACTRHTTHGLISSPVAREIAGCAAITSMYPLAENLVHCSRYLG